jgi:hypothetical protein
MGVLYGLKDRRSVKVNTTGQAMTWMPQKKTYIVKKITPKGSWLLLKLSQAAFLRLPITINPTRENVSALYSVNSLSCKIRQRG